MDISAALSADLADLGQELLPSSYDLTDSVRLLRRDATLAVRSVLGLTLTVVIRDEPVTLTSIDEWVKPVDIRSALVISLPSVRLIQTAGLMTFYAEEVHAFDQLADDLNRELAEGEAAGLGPDRITVRTDTSLPLHLSSGLSGIHDLSSVNQAVGVLIAGGHSYDSAFDYLSEQVTPEADLHEIAARVLRTGGVI